MRSFFLSLWERIEVRAFFLRGDLKVRKNKICF
jgi:hypothetical protein